MTRLRTVALFGLLCTIALVSSPASAQPVTGQLPGIVTVGYGVASAPVATASLQFLLGPSAFYGMTMPMPDAVEAMPGTPGPEMGQMPQATLTDDQLDPIVEDLVAAGAPEGAVEVTVPAASDMFGPGAEIAEIRIDLDQPEAGLVDGLVQAVRDAAPPYGLAVLHMGARYEPADCAALTQKAREAAIADARTRAEGLAQGLGVTLGDLVQASESPFYGAPSGGSCDPMGAAAYSGPYGPGTYPTYDPNITEATVSIQVTLTFEIGEAA
jgi:Protein of unknown function (DUF541)